MTEIINKLKLDYNMLNKEIPEKNKIIKEQEFIIQEKISEYNKILYELESKNLDTICKNNILNDNNNRIDSYILTIEELNNKILKFEKEISKLNSNIRSDNEKIQS